MKTSSSFWSTLQPLYVLVTSLIGFAFITVWLKGPFPIPGDPNPESFTQAVMYHVWVFEHAITFAFITVVFLPLWKQFIQLYKECTSGQPSSYKIGITLMLVLGGAIFLAFFLLLMQLSSVRVAARPELWPQGLTEHMSLLFYYPLAAILSIPLSSLLLYIKVSMITDKIADAKGGEAELFEITGDLLHYRSLLQNNLLIMGLVVSMVPIDSATLRSILILFQITTEEFLPATAVIAYGLGFSAILILFYAPVHLMLTQASQKLRDALCPIGSLDELDKNLKRRKDLDDWLQINLSLGQNLRAGIITLAPLITSFVTSILGVKL